ncbi:hypothetical protein, partial [Klebsiella variicola]|uniref:hypothetical protein n=1 Tax=Klebsiella variicola TaxID=244366 RepID=UPI0027315819
GLRRDISRLSECVAKNLLNLTLVRPTRIRQPTRVLQRIGGEQWNVFGGMVAGILHRTMDADRQINTGLLLIAVSGLVMLWLAWQFGLSAATVLV